MANATVNQVPTDNQWVTWAIYLAGGIGVAAFIFWSNAQTSRDVTCIGSHNIAIPRMANPSTLVFVPIAGSEPHKIAMGANCAGLNVDVLTGEGAPASLCVGDDMAKLGTAEGQCKIESINVLTAAQLSAYLSQTE